jgi:hypothetical protein
LIADPITAFGKKKALNSSAQPANREGSLVLRLKKEIVPKAQSQLRPLEPYKSPRDQTREKVYNEIHYHQRIRDAGGITPYLTDKTSMDVVLPRIHGGSSGSLPTREFRGPIY